MTKAARREFSFITIIGLDRKGIVARVSGLLYRNGINIEDISQKVIEGYFVMTMLVDMKDSKLPIDDVRSELERLGKEMKLTIQVQHEEIFNIMHRV